jgi:hypothetical protein
MPSEDARNDKVYVAGAKGQLTPIKTKVWNLGRAAEAEEVLAETTFKWLARLPDDVRPMMLARRFPRIANKIGNLWRRVARCEEYLDSLVIDERNGRRGFPPEVAQELTKLRTYYAELHPAGKTPWDFVELGK